MWTHHRADEVMRSTNGGHPVTQGFIDGILEGATAAAHRGHLGVEEFHTEDVEGLTFDVLFAHINFAFESEDRCRRGGGDAMLPSSSFGNDAPFSHAAG